MELIVNTSDSSLIAAMWTGISHFCPTTAHKSLLRACLKNKYSKWGINARSEFDSPLVCNDTDFQTTMSIVKVLICHADHVFAMLPRADTATQPKTALFDNLPPTFDSTTYIQAPQRLGIPD